ncbi:MAG TPA: SpoIIE family protein phosphatase [Solirubrobacterales bacterium]|nr:SpoIIE family protein phosphatase [Solirubrobacterales bacterium]
MKVEEELFAPGLEDLFENAPCGYLSTAPDGTILKVNRTFEQWTGYDRRQLVGRKRFAELLTPGGRMYHETHYAPLLQMQGEAREIALELVGADGSRLPALVTSVVVADGEGKPQVIRTTVFDASERRRYEEELLQTREREREIARQLQRSMLAGELPAAPGLQVGASYRPADNALEVGGDWYDAFWLGEERLGMVVGDVVGKGIGAAATMGQLRSAVRALASTGLRPGPLLEALDDYTHRHGVGATTTVVYAQLDLASRELRFACAGHLPPILVEPESGPHLSWEGRSTPLGLRIPGPRPESACVLPTGSLFLLYTDGLVERRTQPIDSGLERLQAEVAERREEPPPALAPNLLRALGTGEHGDDACVLALSLG